MTKRTKPTTIVVLPDAHADPDFDNERFSALGRMLVDLAAEKVNLKLVCLGDFGDFNSLSYFSKGKKCSEGKRYGEDVECFHDAMKKLLAPMQRAGKKFADMVFCIGNHECLDKDTEVCTKGGWKSIVDVDTSDEVLTLGGWEKVDATTSYRFDGMLEHHKNQGVDVLCTPNHRMYYYTSNGRLLVKESHEMPKTFDIPVSIRNDKERKYVNDWLFSQAGLCKEKFETTNNVHLPEFVWDMSSEDFDVFLEALVSFDGSVHPSAKKGMMFYGKKEICDDVQRACNMHGYRAFLNEYGENQWRVNIVKTHKSRIYDKEFVEYHDNVYCLSVPQNKNFLMRRNGKSSFVGNCRISTYVENDATLEGTMGIDKDLKLEEYGWRVSPFLTPIVVDGFAFSHYFTGGTMNKPVGGIHVAHSMLSKGHTSVVCGHSHLRNFAEHIGYDGKRRIGIVAGCFYDFDMSWTSKQVNNLAWRGVVVLRNVKDGNADVSFVSLDTIMKTYHRRYKQVMKRRKNSGMEYRPTFIPD